MQVLEHVQRMSPERFLAIYQSLEQHGFGPLDAEVAKKLRFRPQAIRKLPMEERAKTAKRMIETMRNSELAYELLGAYLLKNSKELVTGFLDATGVAHDQGMITDIAKDKPAVDKIPAAVAQLDQKYAPEDVTIYLAIAAEQWPDVEPLDALWRARA